MGFGGGEWVLGRRCAKCRTRNAIFCDPARGAGPIEAPLKGEFRYRCEHCGWDNAVTADDLERFQTGQSERAA